MSLIPETFAPKAIPTPQALLFGLPTIWPAHRVPWLSIIFWGAIKGPAELIS